MSFENPNDFNSEPETKEENMETQEKLKLFKNTEDFEDRAKQDPEKAEEWMNAVFAEDERYRDNKRWLMERQRTLLDVYCEQGDEEGAKRMIEQTPDLFAKQDRIKKFENAFGREYPEKDKEVGFIDDPESNIEITDSTSFKHALLNEGRRGIEKGKEWLEQMEAEGSYNSRVLEDRKKELELAKRHWEET